MGGGQSKSPGPPPPPRVVEQPYPKSRQSLTNLSLAPGITSDCSPCDIRIDTRVSTSSVRLTRDFGEITQAECLKYQNDLASVRAQEMSVRDFINNLQEGLYSRPVSQSDRGQFCEQVSFPDDVVKNINTIADFNNNESKLKSIRIRKVSGSGGFSSGTKAKFKLSLPIKVSVATTGRVNRAPPVRELKGMPWHWITTPGSTTTLPDYRSIMVSSLALYHPSPVRIENIQHDAVLSLNDPSDFKSDTPSSNRNVILIPLKSSNIRDESSDFFNVIVKHLPSIQEPLDIGVYAETDIPTGNNWNIKQVFWLDPPDKNTNLSKVTDGFFTWVGAADYRRVERSRVMQGNQPVITYGWVPTGAQTRYFMLERPVSISANDLSLLTRSLPPTPPENAIHFIPDPSIKLNPKILYKPATGQAAKASCSTFSRTPLERMTNMNGSVLEMFTDGKGNPLKDSCDPFAMNAKNVSNDFTPMKLFDIIYKVLMVIAVAIGAWIALYLVANKNFDYKYKDFSDDAGKVVGKLARQTSEKVKNISSISSQFMDLKKGTLPQGLPGIPSVSQSADLTVPGAAPAPTQ